MCLKGMCFWVWVQVPECWVTGVHHYMQCSQMLLTGQFLYVWYHFAFCTLEVGLIELTVYPEMTTLSFSWALFYFSCCLMKYLRKAAPGGRGLFGATVCCENILTEKSWRQGCGVTLCPQAGHREK